MKLLWMDLETTGLDAEKCYPLEVAASLEFEVQGERKLFHYDDILKLTGPMLDSFEREAKEFHLKNSLIQDSILATGTIEGVDENLYAMLVGQGVTRVEPVYLAGSTPHFDRNFIRVHFPRTNALLHYRHLDVSVFKTTARFLKKDCPPDKPKGDLPHRARVDLDETMKSFREWTGKLWV